MNLQTIRKTIDDKKAIQADTIHELDALHTLFTVQTTALQRTISAQHIIQLVAEKTQKILEANISEIVSLALNAIFDDEYELIIEYVTKRNQTEAEFYLIKNGFKLDPKTDGGGVREIASFALRMACWKLKNPKCANFIVADEPFKSINDPSRELHRKAAEMLKYLSEKLDLQIIMISLIPEIEEVADNILFVKMTNGISKVRQFKVG